MVKEGKKMKGTITDLLNRRSIRAYSSEQITKEQLDDILKVGTYSASGMGKQSSTMVVVQDKETVEMLAKLNASITSSEDDPFYGAPTVIIVFGDTNIRTYLQDASLVMGNLMNAAYAVGVDSCYINRAKEMFETEAGKELLKKWGLTDNHVGVANCILGYHTGEYPEPAVRKDNYIIFD